jgi:hypothetical protein
MNRRLVMAVMCVPMPPTFLALPLRQIILPFIGPLPVNSQNLPIKCLSLIKARAMYQGMPELQAIFPKMQTSGDSSMSAWR